jgi:enterochelin esterase-like enzyme
MSRSLLLSVFLILPFLPQAQTPFVTAGRIVHIDQFPSEFIAARNIDIWLPPGYNEKKKYAVLYMHDGQMLFDTTYTWNKQEWSIDETLSMLIRNNQVKETIVVGIYNTDDRWLEYFPEKPFDKLPAVWQDSVIIGMQLHKKRAISDSYLKFIVKELKPFVDSAYSTYTDLNNTFMMGSSMGALISMYAVCEYPNVFGGAACLSTHWPAGYNPDDQLATKAIRDYMKVKLPSPLNHRFYFDYGTEGLDKHYEPHQKIIDAAMKYKGYNKGNWLTLQFFGADHMEDSWKRRVAGPLFFLLKKPVELK